MSTNMICHRERRELLCTCTASVSVHHAEDTLAPAQDADCPYLQDVTVEAVPGTRTALAAMRAGPKPPVVPSASAPGIDRGLSCAFPCSDCLSSASASPRDPVCATRFSLSTTDEAGVGLVTMVETTTHPWPPSRYTPLVETHPLDIGTPVVESAMSACTSAATFNATASMMENQDSDRSHMAADSSSSHQRLRGANLPHRGSGAGVPLCPSQSTTSTHYFSATSEFPSGILAAAGAEDSQLAASCGAGHALALSAVNVPTSVLSLAPTAANVAKMSPSTLPTSPPIHSFPSPLTIHTSPDPTLCAACLAMAAKEEEGQTQQAATWRAQTSALNDSFSHDAALALATADGTRDWMSSRRLSDAISARRLPPAPQWSREPIDEVASPTTYLAQTVSADTGEVTPLISNLDVARLAHLRQTATAGAPRPAGPPPLPAFLSLSDRTAAVPQKVASVHRTDDKAHCEDDDANSGEDKQANGSLGATAAPEASATARASVSTDDLSMPRGQGVLSPESGLYAPIDVPSFQLPRIIATTEPLDDGAARGWFHKQPARWPSPPRPTAGYSDDETNSHGRAGTEAIPRCPANAAIASDGADAGNSQRWCFRTTKPTAAPAFLFATREMIRAGVGSEDDSDISRTNDEASTMEASALPRYSRMGLGGAETSLHSLARTMTDWLQSWRSCRHPHASASDEASVTTRTDAKSCAFGESAAAPVSERDVPPLPTFTTLTEPRRDEDDNDDGLLPPTSSCHGDFYRSLDQVRTTAMSTLGKVVGFVSPMMASLNGSPQGYTLMVSPTTEANGGDRRGTDDEAAQTWRQLERQVQQQEQGEDGCGWLVLDDTENTHGAPHLLDPPQTPFTSPTTRHASRRQGPQPRDSLASSGAAAFFSPWFGMSSAASTSSPTCGSATGECFPSTRAAEEPRRARVTFPSFSLYGHTERTPRASSDSLCGLQRNACTSVTEVHTPTATTPRSHGHVKTSVSDAVTAGQLADQLYALFRRPPSMDLRGHESCVALFHSIEAHDAQRKAVQTLYHTRKPVISVVSLMSLLDPEELMSHGQFFPHTKTLVTLEEFTNFIEVVSIQFHRDRDEC